LDARALDLDHRAEELAVRDRTLASEEGRVAGLAAEHTAALELLAHEARPIPRAAVATRMRIRFTWNSFPRQGVATFYGRLPWAVRCASGSRTRRA